MLRGLDEFTSAYIEAALWSSNDNADDSGGEPLDKNYGPEDIETKTLAKMIADCKKFQHENAEYIVPGACKRGTGQYSVSEQAGHDFWLNRNGHGAGFWDGDWSKKAGDAMDKASKAFGGVDLYVHRGRIYS